VALNESHDLTRVKGAPTVADEIFMIYRVENRKVRGILGLSEAIQEGFR
jgi:hypothetical protein